MGRNVSLSVSSPTLTPTYYKKEEDGRFTVSPTLEGFLRRVGSLVFNESFIVE